MNKFLDKVVDSIIEKYTEEDASTFINILKFLNGRNLKTLNLHGKLRSPYFQKWLYEEIDLVSKETGYEVTDELIDYIVMGGGFKYASNKFVSKFYKVKKYDIDAYLNNWDTMKGLLNNANGA